MTSRQFGTAAVVAALAYLLWKMYQATQPTGAVTTSYAIDTTAIGGPIVYSDNLKAFAQAVAQAEGFYVTGSIPQRANNPGDLKEGGTTINGITVFDSVDAGWAALYRQLWLIVTGESNYYNLDMTILDMAQMWTATQPSAWAANVGQALNVDPQTTQLWQVLA